MSDTPPPAEEGGPMMWSNVKLSDADILVLRLALHELRGSEIGFLADEAGRLDHLLETVHDRMCEEQT